MTDGRSDWKRGHMTEKKTAGNKVSVLERSQDRTDEKKTGRRPFVRTSTPSELVVNSKTNCRFFIKREI